MQTINYMREKNSIKTLEYDSKSINYYSFTQVIRVAKS